MQGEIASAGKCMGIGTVEEEDNDKGNTIIQSLVHYSWKCLSKRTFKNSPMAFNISYEGQW